MSHDASSPTRLFSHAAAAAALVLACSSCALLPAQLPQGFKVASTLPDLSGLDYAGNDRFLAVHDAKNPDELDRPRVSIVIRPQDPKGVLYKPLTVNWGGLDSSDLESVARIGGTSRYLLCESGDDGDPTFRRIFRARLAGPQLVIEAAVNWPVPVFNVEATAVARVQGQFYFLYAERDDNAPTTDINWAPFDPANMQFGSFQSVSLPNPDPQKIVRAVVGMDVDRQGRIFTVGSFDPEAAGLPGDPDFGPFRSSVWMIGKIRPVQGQVAVVLAPTPTRIATIDGFKAESVAVVVENQQRQVYVGFDDENYGGTLRPMPPND